MSTLNPSKGLQTYNLGPNHPLQGVFSLARAVVYKETGASANYDPFAGKTNKYAESAVVSIVAKGAAAHVVFGDASIANADTADFYVPADTVMYFIVNSAQPYMRVINDSGTPDIYVTEIY